MALTFSRVLRLVCQAANNKFPLSVCFNHKPMFSVLDRLKINLNQVAVYSTGGLHWREVEGGELPSARWGLRAAMVGDILHVNGGEVDGFHAITAVHAWDPDTESWQDVERGLSAARYNHAAVAIRDDSVVKC